MPSKTWGTMPTVVSQTIVSLNEDIPKGQTLRMKSDLKNGTLNKQDWYNVEKGDLTVIRQKIENEVKGVKVLYVKVSWSSVDNDYTNPFFVEVKGFNVEAYVQNISAGLTGLEIVAILAAVAFLVAIVSVIGVLVWTAWRVITALETMGAGATAVGGFLLIMLLLAAVLLLFGVRFSGGRKGVTVGK